MYWDNRNPKGLSLNMSDDRQKIPKTWQSTLRLQGCSVYADIVLHATFVKTLYMFF